MDETPLERRSTAFVASDALTFTPTRTLTKKDSSASARLDCVSCGIGWSVPCVSIQLLTLSQKDSGFHTQFMSGIYPDIKAFHLKSVLLNMAWFTLSGYEH